MKKNGKPEIEERTDKDRVSRIEDISEAVFRVASGDFSVRLETSPQRDELDAFAVGVSMLAEELGSRVGELKDVMNYTENIIRSLSDSLILVDPGANMRTVNRETCELLGYSEDELIGKPVAMLVAEEEEEEEEEELFFSGGELSKLLNVGSVRDHNMTYLTSNGERIPVSFNGSVMRDEEGKVVGVVGIARDMREIRRLMEKEKELAAAAAAAAAAAKEREDEIRRLSKRIMDEHEEARRRMAADLHDEVSQSLHALKIAMDMLAMEAGTGQAERLEGMGSLLEDIISTVRSLSGELRPPLLDDFGLEKALEVYIEEFSRGAGVAAGLECSGVPLALPKDLGLSLYRITQEALANVQRHADAREARVSLTCEDGILTLVVKDDGRGFDLERPLRGSTPGPHFGLLGMRERANMVKGSFEIRSSPGNGTTVTVSVPFSIASPEHG